NRRSNIRQTRKDACTKQTPPSSAAAALPLFCPFSMSPFSSQLYSLVDFLVRRRCSAKRQAKPSQASKAGVNDVFCLLCPSSFHFLHSRREIIIISQSPSAVDMNQASKYVAGERDNG